MSKPNQIDEAAKACIEVHELVKIYGTPVMKTLMRLLLLEIGQEITRCEAESGETIDGE